jgi:predicted nucleotide-binding protein (sugar kinase/HSP70/actin superfamily)
MVASFPHIGAGWIAFKALLEKSGAEVVVPPKNSKRTLELGVRYSPEFVCLPFKVTLGNMIEALEQGVDTIFMVGGSGTCRLGFYHAVQKRILQDLGYKFDMIVLNQDNLYDALFNKLRFVGEDNSYKKVLRAFRLFWHKSRVIAKIEHLTRKIAPYEMKKNTTYKVKEECLQLVDQAEDIKSLQKTERLIEEKFKNIEVDKANNAKPKIGIVGEVYVTLESYVNFNLEKELINLGVEVYQPMSIYKWLKVLFKIDFERLLTKLVAKKYLRLNTAGEDQQSIGHTIKWAKKGWDGVILLYPFTCAPENVAKGILVNKITKEYNIPLICLALDEHTAKTGLLTRLEAFVDLIKRRKLAS